MKVGQLCRADVQKTCRPEQQSIDQTSAARTPCCVGPEHVVSTRQSKSPALSHPSCWKFPHHSAKQVPIRFNKLPLLTFLPRQCCRCFCQLSAPAPVKAPPLSILFTQAVFAGRLFVLRVLLWTGADGKQEMALCCECGAEAALPTLNRWRHLSGGARDMAEGGTDCGAPHPGRVRSFKRTGKSITGECQANLMLICTTKFVFFCDMLQLHDHLYR